MDAKSNSTKAGGTFKQVLFFTGIWISLICFIFLIFLELFLANRYQIRMVTGAYIVSGLVSIVPTIMITLRNIRAHRLGCRNYTALSWMHNPSLNQYKKETSDAKYKAKYPDIPAQYLYMEPQGIVWGKHINQYVCTQIAQNNILHSCIIGAPGSGKSSGPLLCSLINNFRVADVPPLTCLVIDIKPELAKKSGASDNPHVRIVNPTDNTACGWNPYYALSQESSDDDIIRVMDGIASAIIVGDKTSPPHFVESARKILIGFLLYYYKKSESFIDSVHSILSYSVSDLITLILDDDEGCPADSRVYMQLREFYGADSNAFENIQLYLKKPLAVFGRDDITHFFGRTQKCSPSSLEERNSIFVCIPEYDLAQLSGIVRLILAQTIAMLERREEGRHPIALIVDEFPRLGRMDPIFNALATLRSRNVAITLVMQDLTQIMTTYSREEAILLINLCEQKCILSCADLETSRMISAFVGTYKEQQISIAHNTFEPQGLGNITESIVDKASLDIADITDLRRLREVLLISEGQYMRFDALRYFDDPFF